MKKSILSATALVFAISISYAQNSYPWPSAGKVGIGTTNPTAPLQVNGILNVRTDITTDGYISINSGGASSQGYINWWKPGGTRVAYFGYTDGTGVDNLALTLEASANFIVNGGNVGIGTTSPGVKLDVSGGDMRVYNPVTGSTNMVVGSSDIGKTYLRLTTSADVNGYGILQSVLASGSAWGNTVINPSGGNVGIGTTAPDALLAVNGTIHSREVVVNTTGWPDYVFSPAYHLPALLNVKKYIGQNHRLPGMPSATDAAKDGIKLGEIVKLQTQKIEELTLYLLQKDGQVNELKEELDLVKKQLILINEKLKTH